MRIKYEVRPRYQPSEALKRAHSRRRQKQTPEQRERGNQQEKERRADRRAAYNMLLEMGFPPCPPDYELQKYLKDVWRMIQLTVRGQPSPVQVYTGDGTSERYCMGQPAARVYGSIPEPNAKVKPYSGRHVPLAKMRPEWAAASPYKFCRRD